MSDDSTDPLLSSAQQTLENYKVFLEMVDGAVAEGVRHGWTEPQARTLALAMFAPISVPPVGGTPDA